MAPEPSGKKDNLSEAGKKEGLATRRVALCTSTCAPTAIELRQRTFLFRHALRISMFSVYLDIELLAYS